MKRSIILFISIIFVFITIISVTFGMWTISNANGGLGNFISHAEKAINTNDFIYYDITKGNGEGIDSFSYYKTGFLNSDGSLSDTGYLTLYYIVDIDKVKEEFDEYDTLKIDFCLMNANSTNETTFQNFMNNINLECYDGVNTQLSLSGNTCFISMGMDELEASSGLTELEIKFKFTAQSVGLSFQNNVYNYLKDISFCINTEVEGIKN